MRSEEQHIKAKSGRWREFGLGRVEKNLPVIRNTLGKVLNLS